MVRYSSNMGQLMYGVESSYGSEQTASLYFGRYTSSNFNSSNNLINDYDANGRSIQNIFLGKFTGRGSVSFDVIDFSPFQYLLGARTGSGTGADPYVYSVGSTLNSLTIEQGVNSSTDVNYTYIGCMCNTWSISANKGEPIRCRSEWLYQTEKIDSTLVAYTAPTSSPFIFLQGNLQRNNTNVAAVQSFSISGNNNLVTDDDAFNRLIQGLYVGQSLITFDLTVNLDSGLTTTLMSDYYGQAVGSGPILTGTGILTGCTLDLDLTNGANRVVAVTGTVATINSFTRPHDIGNNMVQVSFNGTFKALTITEQVSA